MIDWARLASECGRRRHVTSIVEMWTGIIEIDNCGAFEKTMTRMESIEDEVANQSGDHTLICALEGWRRLMQKRDRAMVDCIYRHCGEHAVETGVFLVGAAHRMSLVKAINEYSGAQSRLVDWTFYQAT